MAETSRLLAFEQRRERHDLPQRRQADGCVDGSRRRRTGAEQSGDEVEVEQTDPALVDASDDDEDEVDDVPCLHLIASPARPQREAPRVPGQRFRNRKIQCAYLQPREKTPALFAIIKTSLSQALISGSRVVPSAPREAGTST